MGRLPSGFTKRKDGRLMLSFSMDGKRYQVYGHTVAECREKEIEKRQRILDGLTNNENITLRKYYHDWQDSRRNSVKPSTIYTQDRRFTYIDKEIGNKKLVKISQADVIALQKKLSKKLTPAGTNLVIDLLKSVLNAAVYARIISWNPCNGVKRVKDQRIKNNDTDNHRCILESDLKLFFEYGRDSYYLEFFQMLYHTGMRTGELAALAWSDIDAKRGLIHVTKTVTRVGDNDHIITTPKTRDSIRDIELTPSVRQILKSWKEKYYALHGNVINMDNRIFPASNGKGYVTAQNLCPVIKATLKRVEKATGRQIPHFAPHAFRDSYATQFIAQGGRVEVLARLLGHTDIKITMNKYVKPNREMVQNEVRKISLVM